MRQIPRLLTALIVAMAGSAFATPVKTVGVSEKKTDGPLLSYKNAESELKARVSLLGRYETVDAIPTDANGTEFAPDAALNLRVRVGADYRHSFRKYVWLDASYEHDLYTGVPYGGFEDERFIDAQAAPGGTDELRQAKLGLRLGYVALGGGVTTSHWGLGLLANGGSDGWTPQNASFSDPRSGDRVLRGYLLVGPISPLKVAVSLAADQVIEDDVLVGDDEASQIIAAVMLNPRGKTTAGIYTAFRSQEHDGGKTTDVTAIDVYGKWTRPVGKHYTLMTALEVATIIGTTDLGPNPDYPTHDIVQVGAMSRTSFNAERWGGVLDIVYASGDDNLDDDTISNFKVDRNLHVGQVLFRHAVSGMTARSPVTAADPELVGYPADDLDRLPSRQAVTSTVSVFPRIWWTPDQQLHLYGGPLFAFSSALLTDPLNTRVGGGTPHNALNGEPGNYLGTEFNLGARYLADWRRSQLMFGVELAYFTPGSAFVDADGNRLDPLTGARLLVGYDL